MYLQPEAMNVRIHKRRKEVFESRPEERAHLENCIGAQRNWRSRGNAGNGTWFYFKFGDATSRNSTYHWESSNPILQATHQYSSRGDATNTTADILTRPYTVDKDGLFVQMIQKSPQKKHTAPNIAYGGHDCITILYRSRKWWERLSSEYVFRQNEALAVAQPQLNDG
jgi:hypothetical protein